MYGIAYGIMETERRFVNLIILLLYATNIEFLMLFISELSAYFRYLHCDLCVFVRVPSV
jgi:hypothetical protein